MRQVKVLSTASSYPQKILDNCQLEQMVNTSDQWIMDRTGIKERRISSPAGGEWPSDLAARAAKVALAEISMDPNQIDGIICATMTPDYKTPNVACMVQEKLGITNHCLAYDLNSACAGYLYAFNTATSYIKSGWLNNILVIGADCMSSIIDYQNRNTCIIFGDGAGVAILSAQEAGESDVLASSLGANGHCGYYITMENGGSARPLTKDNIDERKHFIHIKGQETFKSAVKTMADDSLRVLAQAGVNQQQINWIIPHQANLRILEAVAARMDFPMERMVVNIEKFGNTTGATIPTGLDQAIRDGRIQRGDHLLLTAFGAGLAWGSAVVRY